LFIYLFIYSLRRGSKQNIQITYKKVKVKYSAQYISLSNSVSKEFRYIKTVTALDLATIENF